MSTDRRAELLRDHAALTAVCETLAGVPGFRFDAMPDAAAEVRRSTWFENEGRALKVCVVGRVKAGKSSLLNALLFGGRDVLPRAATPMTAALTELTWGERLQVRVEFFNMEDRAAIASRAQEYEIELEQQVRAEMQRQAAQAALDGFSSVTDEARVRKREASKLRSHPGRAMAELQASMVGIRTPERGAGDGLTLSASDTQSLSDLIGPYVTANGEFTPLTKLIRIEFPDERLRDMTIVDTPGVDDPVPSRSQRTDKALSEADAVLVLSPAGQFLNSEDLSLMARITLGQGVPRVALVASQVDTQILASERRKRVEEALAQVGSKLAERARDALGELRRTQPEIGHVFDPLIDDSTRTLILSAGICHGMSRTFAERAQWAPSEETVWSNLVRNYPDEFPSADDARARRSLDKLANIDTLQELLVDVRRRKKELKAGRSDEIESALATALRHARERLKRWIASSEILAQGEVAKVDAKRTLLADIGQLLTHRVNANFASAKETFLKVIVSDCNVVLERAGQESAHSAEREVAESDGWRVERNAGWMSRVANWAWGGGTTTKSVTHRKLHTAPIYTGLYKLAFDLPLSLREAVGKRRTALFQTLARELPQQLSPLSSQRDSLPTMDSEQLEISLHAVFEKLNALDFKMAFEVPLTLSGRGTVEEAEVIGYMDEAKRALDSLMQVAHEAVRAFVREASACLPADPGAVVLARLHRQLDDERKLIVNAELVLKTLTLAKDQLKAVA